MVNLTGPATHVSWPTDTSVSRLSNVVAAAMRRGVTAGDVRPTGNSATSRDPETGARAGMDGANVTRRDGERPPTMDDGPTSDVVEPSTLARTGLFHAGQTGRALSDSVLYRWLLGDVPEVEHRRHFYDCPLARDVDNVTLQRDSSLDLHMPVDDAIRFTFADPGSPISFTAGAATPSHPSNDTTNNRPEFVNRHQCPAAGSSEHQTVFGISAELQKIQNTTTVANTTDDERRLMTAENRRLHEAKACRVCADKEVTAVFHPCGHLVSCDRCSPQLLHCPVCGTHILGTVNSAHFSHKLNELSTSIVIG